MEKKWWRWFVYQFDSSLHSFCHLCTGRACPSSVSLCTAAAISEMITKLLESWNIPKFRVRTYCCVWQCCQHDSRHWAEWPCSNWLCYSYPSISYQRLLFRSTLCIWHVVKLPEDCWSLQTYTFDSGKIIGNSASAYLARSQTYTGEDPLLYMTWISSCQITWILTTKIA